MASRELHDPLAPASRNNWNIGKIEGHGLTPPDLPRRSQRRTFRDSRASAGAK